MSNNQCEFCMRDATQHIPCNYDDCGGWQVCDECAVKEFGHEPAPSACGDFAPAEGDPGHCATCGEYDSDHLITLHKAEPKSVEGQHYLPTTYECRHCNGDIHQVPGGHGPTWVHSDGYVVARNPEPELDPRVYVLMIEHKHGVNTYVHRTSEGAQASLLDFVTTWWDDTCQRYDDAERDMPADADEAIALYFDIAEDESYWLDETAVRP